MESGYVLDFSNGTFAEFFHDELDVDIDDPRWAAEGGSKAKRLRYYLRQVDRKTALATLNALWEYREASSITADYPALDDSVRVAYSQIVEGLEGKPSKPTMSDGVDQEQRVDRAASSALATRLVEVSTMDPQARGYAFEKFLKDAFDAHGMSARASFRRTGEQIDGSFVLGEQTYLLEARWRNAKVDAETLRAFNAKVEDKASWSRGLIISQSGFTSEGLHAFGRGKSVVCMDGLDLYEVLSGRLDLAEVIRLKVRRVAETGVAFVPVRELDFRR
ncbi:MAG: restriction endonuclease [Gammaproteobacteria bacterium]|nr:restriction endonuclease [Gammaproteobacteria bacterium]